MRAGLEEKSDSSVPSPESQYAGTAAATTPGERWTTSWPLAAGKIHTLASPSSTFTSSVSAS